MPSKGDQDSLASILASQFPMIVVTAVVVGVAVWILDYSIGRDLEANRVALETSAAEINIALEESHAAIKEVKTEIKELKTYITMSFDRLERVIRSEFESLRTATNADRIAADAEMRELRNLVLPPATEQAVIEE